MTATNHALTGAVIGTAIGNPWLAVPLAVTSHFICDALPHFGTPGADWVRGRAFKLMLLLDAVLCLALVGLLRVSGSAHWLLASVCAFAAAAPDMGWINYYRTSLQGKVWRPSGFSRFAARIQWFERPIGAVVEAAWFIGMTVILFTLIRNHY